MKLLQLNMWGGRLESQILRLVAHLNPDILCLQESISMESGNSGLFVTVEEIQDSIGAGYIFMSPVYTFNFMGRKASFGNCIISKFPINNTDTVFTGREYIADFDSRDHSFNIRNLQHAVIELPDDKKLNVLNHHGHHVNQHKNGDAETMRQCAVIADKVLELNDGIVLTGDFNLAPKSKSIAQINTVLDNLSIRANLDTTRTELTHKMEVCDYIFVNDKVEVQNFEALDTIVSDHKALVMEFE